MVIKNGGISIKRIKNVPSWLIKTILFEPFRWLELAFYQKSIIKHNISKDPVFILGFYRSGTSYLHEFFTQDDRIGYHTNFQMVFPDMMRFVRNGYHPYLSLFVGFLISMIQFTGRGYPLGFPAKKMGQ
jgi:hypothetical protein